jgi:hypothetical protein
VIIVIEELTLPLEKGYGRWLFEETKEKEAWSFDEVVQ